METKKENPEIGDAMGSREAEGAPACPFCTTALSLVDHGAASANYACQSPNCDVGYLRSVCAGGGVGGFETAHHRYNNLAHNEVEASTHAPANAKRWKRDDA